MKEYQSNKDNKHHFDANKAKSIDELTQKNINNGSVYVHTIKGKIQPTHDSDGTYSGDTTTFTHNVYEIKNAVEGLGDLHIINLPDGEVLMYRVIKPDTSSPAMIRKLMKFNPMFNISKGLLGLIQRGLGNPVGQDNFNQDEYGNEITAEEHTWGIADGIISIALAPTKIVKFAYMGLKADSINYQLIEEREILHNSIPENVRDLVVKNVFDTHFTFGKKIIPLEKIE